MKVPTIEEAKAYCESIGHPDFDVEHWWWTNESRGWVVVVGKGYKSMHSWKGNIQTWIRNQKRYSKRPAPANEQTKLLKRKFLKEN